MGTCFYIFEPKKNSSKSYIYTKYIHGKLWGDDIINSLICIYKNPYFFVITRPNQMGSSLKCREIVIFSLHEIILWFTHYFESYPCGKSDCNFFWDIWYIQNTYMENCEAMTSSTHSFAYSYRLFQKCNSKFCVFLIFFLIYMYMKFSLFCSKCFTLSFELT